MEKISIVVDVNKINKSKLVSREYTNKDGVVVSLKEMKLDVIPLREKQLKKDGGNWMLFKVGFVTETPTKEEKANKVKLPIIGEAIQFESQNDSEPVSQEVANEINPQDIPF